MYPPSEETDSERNARNRAQGSWILRWVMFVVVLINLATSPNVKHRLLGCTTWVVFVLVCRSDSILEKMDVSARLRRYIRIAAMALCAAGIFAAYRK